MGEGGGRKRLAGARRRGAERYGAGGALRTNEINEFICYSKRTGEGVWRGDGRLSFRRGGRRG